MTRTFKQRLDAIPVAEEAKAKFIARLRDATGDPDAIAFLMAEAIDMSIQANGVETIGRDGRVMVCIEQVFAAHCMVAAVAAFRAATSQTPQP